MLGPHVPDLVALEVFVAVGEEGSISRAARRLGMSQQAVSARMRSMEKLIGSELLIRTARGSTLSPAGRVVSGWAGDVLAAAQLLDAGIASLRSQTARQLNVAASLTIAEYLLPRWLVALRTRQEASGVPPTQVGLTAANSEDVIDFVRSGHVPLGFIETAALPSGLRVRRIGFDELRVAVAPHHTWARRSSPVTVNELVRTPLVSREPGSGTRSTFEMLLTAASGGEAIAAPRVELSSTAAVRTSIAAGTAPGVLSSLAIADDLALGRLVAVPVEGLTLRRQLSAIWRTGNTPPLGPAQDLVTIACAGSGTQPTGREA